ncbi:MAG: lipopolysaccharide biosynthesis protein [Hyphomonadaceae bacterium]|nr:lipopolysaccharide biosynthesis protein [Hyphomonadaceae bacterium]
MGKRLAKGVVWTAGARIAVNIIGLVSTLLMARLLTPADFGLVALATSSFAIVGALTQMSLAAALIQHPSPEREHFDTAWTLNLCRGLLVSGILALAAEPLAAFYRDDRLVAIIYALSGVTVLSSMSNPKLVEFNRRLSFTQDFIAAVPAKLAGFLVGIGIAIAYQTYWALVIGSIASQVLSVLISYVLIPYRPRVSFAHTRDLFSFSIWLVMGSAVSAVSQRADQVIVGRALGTHDLGQYNVGENLASLPVQESTAPLTAVLFPAFSRLQSDPPRLRAAFVRAQRLMFAVGLPVGVGLALIAEPLVMLVLGPQWSQAIIVVQVLSTILALNSLSSTFTGAAMALKRTRMIFQRDFAVPFYRIPLILGGLFWGGFVGVVIARWFVGLISICIDIFLAQRLLGVSAVTQVVSNWRTLLSVTLMSAVVIGLQHLGIDRPTLGTIVILVIVGAVAYGVSMFALWLMTGRPLGPVQEALDLVQFWRQRLSGRALGPRTNT